MLYLLTVLQPLNLIPESPIISSCSLALQCSRKLDDWTLRSWHLPRRSSPPWRKLGLYVSLTLLGLLLFMVKKKDGGWSLCGDYRRLNTVTCLIDILYLILLILLRGSKVQQFFLSWTCRKDITRFPWLRMTSARWQSSRRLGCLSSCACPSAS